MPGDEHGRAPHQLRPPARTFLRHARSPSHQAPTRIPALTRRLSDEPRGKNFAYEAGSADTVPALPSRNVCIIALTSLEYAGRALSPPGINVISRVPEPAPVGA